MNNKTYISLTFSQDINVNQTYVFQLTAGIWGSVFCIQFKRLLKDDKNIETSTSDEREDLGKLGYFPYWNFY